jgi:molybdenum cofactor synthesis domain-containing protein
MKDVEIFSVGDELLRGVVQDTNSHWMAKRVTARGANLARVSVLPDDPEIVGAELVRALDRAPALILTQGGLGPTDDDRTREAIAIGTRRPLEANEAAEKIVVRRYAELAAAGIVADAALHEARLRMTRLPRGARAIDNQIGAAPGVVLDLERTTIVALPGVPPELQWIWDNPLAPELDRILGPGGFAEITVRLDLHDESAIVEILRDVQSRHPDVYVKSRAKSFDSGDEIRATLTAAGSNDAAARQLVEDAFADLGNQLERTGVGFLPD